MGGQVASLGGGPRGVLSPGLTGGSGGPFPEEILKNRGLKTPFLAISGSNKKELNYANELFFKKLLKSMKKVWGAWPPGPPAPTALSFDNLITSDTRFGCDVTFPVSTRDCTILDPSVKLL